MVTIRVCLTLTFLLSLASCELFQPTKHELLKALAFQTPRKGWGYQARQERDIRLFAVGGSNTRFNDYPNSIIKDFANSTNHPDWRASFNKFGVSGVMESDLIGTKYEFENWNDSSWPNIFMIELSANIHVWESTNVTENVDVFMTMIRRKYFDKNLPEPDFMFLELFTARELVFGMTFGSSYKYKMRALETINDNNICGVVPIVNCANYYALRRVAAFYDYPIVSWRELALNAFIRYYLATNVSFKARPWTYSIDGLHISHVGAPYLYDTLLGPFFHQVMVPRIEPKWENNGSVTPLKRMFPPSSQGHELINLNVKQLIREPTNWKWVEFHTSDTYCSNDRSDSLILDFNIPAECAHDDTCTVSLGFVHCWNATQYGNMDCELSPTNSKSVVGHLLVDSSLDEHGKPMRITAVVRTTMSVPNMSGNYTFTCNKLDSRETCLKYFNAHRIMEV